MVSDFTSDWGGVPKRSTGKKQKCIQGSCFFHKVHKDFVALAVVKARWAEQASWGTAALWSAEVNSAQTSLCGMMCQRRGCA